MKGERRTKERASVFLVQEEERDKKERHSSSPLPLLPFLFLVSHPFPTMTNRPRLRHQAPARGGRRRRPAQRGTRKRERKKRAVFFPLFFFFFFFFFFSVSRRRRGSGYFLLSCLKTSRHSSSHLSKKKKKDAGDPPYPRRPQRPPRRRVRPARRRRGPQRRRRRRQHAPPLGRDARPRRDHHQIVKGRRRPGERQRAGAGARGPLPGVLVPGVEVREGGSGWERESCGRSRCRRRCCSREVDRRAK